MIYLESDLTQTPVQTRVAPSETTERGVSFAKDVLQGLPANVGWMLVSICSSLAMLGFCLGFFLFAVNTHSKGAAALLLAFSIAFFIGAPVVGWLIFRKSITYTRRRVCERGFKENWGYHLHADEVKRQMGIYDAEHPRTFL